MKRIAITGAAAVLAVGGAVSGVALAGSNGKASGAGTTAATQSYTITVENLTGSQPLSPPVIVTHNRRADIWTPGTIASHALAGVAEDANGPVAVAAHEKQRGVLSATVGAQEGADPAPIPPGESQTYTIAARPGQLISLYSMLVNTNDAFTSVRNVRVTNRDRSARTIAWDGGSEVNNQLASHIPGPVGGNAFVREPEGDVIRRHPGIQQGVGDPAVQATAWEGRVARISMSPAG